MISVLLVAALAGLLVAMLLAPVEALGWWAGWYGDELEQPGAAGDAPYREVGAGKQAKHYVIFLDGIGKAGADNYDDVAALLDGLSAALPEAVVLGDVMPYSVRNVGLTEGRPLAHFWRSMVRFKREGRHTLIAFTINLRNLLQVLVAVDSRYGPIYSQGQAQVMLNSLLEYGYPPASGVPVTLIGYSGGGQIALGATPFLKRALGAPVSVVSLAGVMRSDPGLAQLEHLYHLVGRKDFVPSLGRVAFPGRWPVFVTSHWNRLRRQRKLTIIPMGPMTHDGPGSYLDGAAYVDGESFLDRTVATLAELVKQIHHSSGTEDSVGV